MAMDVDPSELRSSTYHRFTTYTNSFFLLRVPLMINEQLSAIGCSEGMLTLNSRYPSLGITFDSLFNDVNAVVKKYGISEITNHWIEDVPLFELKYSSPDGMAKFIRSAEMVQNEIASRISEQLAKASGSTSCHQSPRLPVVVHTEVFLITPDPASRDTDLKLVTSENLPTCIAKQKKSEVVNFGALFRRYKIKGSPTEQQLFEDLNGIVEWFQLGMELGVPGAELKKIRYRSDDVRGRRCEMLFTWLKTTPQPTWAAIVNALASIRRRNLADKMALKYSVPVNSSRETKQVSKQVSKPVPMPRKKRDPIQQKLSIAVQDLQSAIESKDMELAVNKHTTTEALNARDIARGRLDEFGKKAVELQTNVARMIKISTDIQCQLDLRHHEASKKHQEIQKLQEELKAVQAELASEKEKVRSLPKQLQQAKKELAVKTARVRELESAQQELETLLEHWRERCDQLLMQKSVASDPQKHGSEIKYQLVTAKNKLAGKKAEVISLKKIAAFLEREVERLSAEVSRKEAYIEKLLMQLSQPQMTKPDHTQELKSKEELQRLKEEVSELRARLYQAEDAKQKALRLMEAEEQKSRLLQEIVKESMLTPPPVPPKPAQKPQSTSTSALLGRANNSWEYEIFTKNSPDIVDKLAHVMLAAKVAGKLNAAGIIGDAVTAHVYSHGPGITETSRLQHIITALKDKIQLDAQRYHDFRQILVSLGADADTALHYMPEKDPTVLTSPTMKARTPSKDQDPTVLTSPTMKARTPSKDQGHATQCGEACSIPKGLKRGAAVSHGNMTYFNSVNSTTVYSYESQHQLLRRLPDCHSQNFALVIVDDRLTTIGGRKQYGQPINSLASLTGEGTDSKWVELFPQMPTARSYLVAVCSGRNVIAAGGYGDGGNLNTVEILDTDVRKWSSAASLPHPMCWASITVYEDFLYLLGGEDQYSRTRSVLTSSITDLLTSSNTDLLHQQQETANQLAVWKRAADVPYYWSTAVCVGGQLLAIGGQDNDYEDTAAIVAYDPISNSWQDMAHMATPQRLPLAAVLPSNQLIVADGLGGLTKVQIGNVV